MKTGGVYLLLIGLTIVASSPQGEISTTDLLPKTKWKCAEGDNNEKCKNTTLLVSLERNVTLFRFFSCANNSLLNNNYSSTTSRGIKKFIQFTFLYFYPESRSYIIPLQNYSSEINVMKNIQGSKEVISVMYEGETILQSEDTSTFTRNSLNNHNSSTSERVCGRLTNIEVTAAQDIDANKLDAYDMTALHWAAMLGNTELGSRLIRRGANINTAGSLGLTALHWAAATGQAEFSRLLAEEGANLELGRDGGTALHLAAELGRTEVVRTLAVRGACFDRRHEGRTPLLKAARGGHADTVRELVRLGADIAAKGPSGRTALHEAAAFGHLEVVRVFLGVGADLNVRDNDGLTPLILAADRSNSYGDNIDVLQLLLQFGANINAKDYRGRSALTMSKHFSKIANFLKSNGAIE